VLTLTSWAGGCVSGSCLLVASMVKPWGQEDTFDGSLGDRKNCLWFVIGSKGVYNYCGHVLHRWIHELVSGEW